MTDISSKLSVTILDQINVRIEGAALPDIRRVIDQVGVMVPGAVHTAAFKLKAWNGKEAQLNEEGMTFLHMLPEVLSCFERLGYRFDLINRRPSMPLIQPIDKSFLLPNIELRDHQVDAVNYVLKYHHGLLDISVSGGKSYICIALSLAYYRLCRLKTLVIVPSNSLVTQMTESYRLVFTAPQQVNNVNQFNSEEVDIFISTWQALARNPDRVKDFQGVVLYDETHVMGASMYSLLKTQLKNCPVRVGLSGSIPTEKYKLQKLMCHIGGPVLMKVAPKTLMDLGMISSLSIFTVPLRHELPMDTIDWSLELKYLNTNIPRLNAIVKFLTSLQPKSRLILCYPELGEHLAAKMKLDFICEKTPQKDRQIFLERYKNNPVYTLAASFQTMGTGISINNIVELVIIDCGKNAPRIIQSIGRGLRLDGVDNHLTVYDLYSDLYYARDHLAPQDRIGYSGSKHFSQRLKLYRELHYPYTPAPIIEVS